MRRLAMILGVCAGAASAEGTDVVTDIAPVQSLAAGIIGEVPTVLLPPGASPHDFSLRPSDAGALADAEVVIWVGAGLTGWLEAPLENLAADATRLTLMETEGWVPRANGAHEKDGHADEHGHEDEDGHEEDHAHGHDHGAYDPHGWMDPDVAAAWGNAIADVMAARDPANAAVYQDRAAAQAAMLQTLGTATAARLKEVGPYILSHDGYGYFEQRFGLQHVDVVSDSDDAAPGPAHLAALRSKVVAGEVACIYYEVGPVPGWVNTLTEGQDIKVIELDPIGAQLPAGADLYATLIENLAEAFAACPADAAGS